MNLAISNVLTWKISKIFNLEDKGAEWARLPESGIASTTRFCKS